MELIVFDDNESALIDICMTVLRSEDNETSRDNIQRINKNINALVELAKAISEYPSVLGTNYFGVDPEIAGSLVNQLAKNEGLDKLMHVPTKAVLGKGFLIAKINFFSTLKYFAETTEELKQEVPVINENIKNIIFTIMSEEVFLSIIENKESDDEIGHKAGFLLANIWEYRLNQGGKDFAPILNSIWDARKKLIPVFGTMMGFSELYKMSESLDPVWLDFFGKHQQDEQIYAALEEFLFTLSYEELTHIREEMKKNGLRCVNREQLNDILHDKHLYPDFDEADVREMYRFFRNRKANSWFRRRADIAGPRMTIEEYIMIHLLSTDDWIVNL